MNGRRIRGDGQVISGTELVGSVIEIKSMARIDQDQWRYPPGRRCVEPDCITLLCRFNPGPKCFIHAAKQQARERSRMEEGERMQLAA